MSSATYLYCLLRNAEAPTLKDVPEGAPGGSPPRLVPVDERHWLVASDVPLADYGEAEIAAHLDDLSWVSDRALAHEAVVEHFTGAVESVIPMKLFTLFTDDARAASSIREDLLRLDGVLDRVAGRREWGVRVSFDPSKAVDREPAPSSPSSGREFLLAKKRQRDAGRLLPQEARSRADEVFESLAEAADASSRRAPESGVTLVLDATFLVPRDASERFREAVATAAGALADAGCELTLTGPWPPYNFVGDGG